MDPQHRQHAYGVRLEWGAVGAEAVAPVDVAVVVDVLSFTTTLTVAVKRGIDVYPYPWRGDRAAAFAAERGAVLAVGRSDATPGDGVATLSPAGMRHVTGVRRLVLPSPNGSTIAALLADAGATVVGACLRNRSAVGAWLAPRVDAGETVAVIPAGERWPDGTLRPALEDLWGAGAVLAALTRGSGLDPDPLSPEARYAEQSFLVAAPADLPRALAASASGRELVGRGFAEDVAVAAALDASRVVPVLIDGVFRAGS